MEFISLSDKAYHLLEEKIVTLELPPGKIFSEAELSEIIGIGRTPMRESLLKLAREKLVEMIPRRGVAITEINITNQLALLDTRRVLDELIARRAAKRATRDQRDELKLQRSTILKAAEKEDAAEFMRYDHEFDEILAHASRNPFACEAVAPLHAHCRRFWYYYREHANLVTSAATHAELMLAVASADEEGAALASNKLIDALVEFTRSVLDL